MLQCRTCAFRCRFDIVLLLKIALIPAHFGGAFRQQQVYLPVPVILKTGKVMCEKIVYRRVGDLYECLLVHDGGCSEVIGSGSREEIIQVLKSGSLDYVSSALISHNLDSLWKA